jgi:hypothetical protein
MFLATSSKSEQLLFLSYVGHVSVQELEQGRADLLLLLDELSPGFRLLADLTQLDNMDVNCATEIGKVMEVCSERGLDMVVRVVPDPAKDIGLNILSLFHYRPKPRIVTCRCMLEAGDVLGFGRRGRPPEVG